MEEMGDLLAPQQLGFGVKGGAEAAVHALRLYLCDPNPGKAVLKLDFKIAFNSIRRDKMLDAVREHVPELHPFIHSAYSLPSSLFWSDKTIQSAEGVQQGDPLGPLLFCPSIHHMGTQLESELSLLYLDEGTLGGSVENLRHDLEVVEREGARMGLQLSREESEIIYDDPDTVSSILQFLPGTQIVDPAKATLLGSPVGDVSSISDILTSKTDMLRRMGERLQLLPAHDAILLLKHSFALPNLLYNLRTAPCFLSPVVQEYDGLLKSSLSGITNIHFGEDDPAWTQATLPVKMGGLGVRSAVQLAPSAFLASAVAASDLVHRIVPSHLQGSPLPHVCDAEDLWSEGDVQASPVGSAQHQQKAWDFPKASALAGSILESAPDSRSRSRLLASTTKESGAGSKRCLSHPSACAWTTAPSR